MYDAKIYRIFIASPSDLVEERNIVEDACYYWNRVNGYHHGKVLQPIRWENDTFSSHGESGQANVNKQALDSADYLIGLFKVRIGSPTDEYESGTVEEIKRHTAAGKPASIYFSERVNIPIKEIDTKQLIQVRKFRKWCEENGLVKSFESIEAFNILIREEIEKIFLSYPKLSEKKENPKPPLLIEIIKIIESFPLYLTGKLDINESLSHFTENEKKTVVTVLDISGFFVNDSHGGYKANIWIENNTLTKLVGSKAGVEQLYYLMYPEK